MSQPPQGPPGNYGPQGPPQPYGQRQQQPAQGWQGQQPPQGRPQLYRQQPPTRQEARAHALAAKAHRRAMRPWFKKKRFILPLALIALVVLAQLLPNIDPAETAGVPGATPSTAAPSGPTSVPAQPKATKTKVPEPQPKVVGIGGTVRGGDWQFKVTKFRCGVKKVGSQYLDKTAQGQFCLMYLSVKNNGKKAETLNGSAQKIFDADDRSSPATPRPQPTKILTPTCSSSRSTRGTRRRGSSSSTSPRTRSQSGPSSPAASSGSSLSRSISLKGRHHPTDQ